MDRDILNEMIKELKKMNSTLIEILEELSVEDKVKEVHMDFDDD